MDKIQSKPLNRDRLFEEFGVLSNPFPRSNLTTGNPRFKISDVDDLAEEKISKFINEYSQVNESQVIVLVGTQGVGKTNFLKYYEEEIAQVTQITHRNYLVRYLANPGKNFSSTIRYIFEELGIEHLQKLKQKLKNDQEDTFLEKIRSKDMERSLKRLKSAGDELEIEKIMMDWLLGLRILKVHREELRVKFWLDTIEAQTTALKDLVEVSIYAGVLDGIFLLLDELEKQGGIQSPRMLVNYLSDIRAIIDALPRGFFLVMAVTPDALKRFKETLPALRGRLQDEINLPELGSIEEALKLADLYLEDARKKARREFPDNLGGSSLIIGVEEIKRIFQGLYDSRNMIADEGVRQRDFLHKLSVVAEQNFRKFNG